jgi:hypothetical protein
MSCNNPDIIWAAKKTNVTVVPLSKNMTHQQKLQYNDESHEVHWRERNNELHEAEFRLDSRLIVA